MDRRIFGGIAFVLVVAIAVLLWRMPGGEGGRHDILAGLVRVFLGTVRATWNLFLICYILVGPWVLGGAARNPAVKRLDEHYLPHKDLSWVEHVILTVLASGIAGLFHIFVVYYATLHNSWIAHVFVVFDWRGYWETAPVLWGLYGFVAALICYGAVHYFTPKRGRW